MMNKLEIEKYLRYSIQYTALRNISIISYLIDTYNNNDLSKFIPKASFEILEKFNIDIENLLLKELDEPYLRFIYKKS